MFSFAVKRGFSLFCLLISVLCLVQDQAARLPVNGSLGQSVYMSPEIPHGSKIEEVIWKQSSLRLRIARYMEGHVEYFGAEDYKKRIKLHPGNFSLQISELQRADTGDYEVIVTANSGKETPMKFKLDVYEPVTGTKISLQITENYNITLSCSVNTGDSTSFSWWRGQEALRDDSTHHLSENGQELQLHFTAQIEDNVYKCETRNPVSEDTAHIKLSDICNVTKHETRSPTTDLLKYLLPGITLPIMFICALIVWIIIKRKKRVANLGSNGQDYTDNPLTIYSEVQRVNGPQEKRPSPEGNEMVPKRAESSETPLTVYDTIKSPGAPVAEPLDKQHD